MTTDTSTSIPRTVETFNPYIRTTVAYMQEGSPVKNFTRLGITEEMMGKWKGFGDRWILAYEKYSDRYNLRTIAVTDELKGIMESIRKYEEESNFLTHIAISPNATITDLETFKIRTVSNVKHSRTIPQTPITMLVTATVQPIGGGSVTIKCFGNTNQRPAIHDTANCVQYRFSVATEAPTSAEDKKLEVGLSTKAFFVLPLGAENAGKQLFIYFRWYNTKHPEIAGPWSKAQNTLIL
ncbi:hypothetical protein [uncultured Acetobacteroides sp.]|uniref:hypothetical protein n=1 Tax=uncultured Acetobacteroides sp. TaxID=1760811 RepID=UPI0029F4F2D7|nr:hypothetical protein [uncultured Acetobacteroides sp.]